MKVLISAKETSLDLYRHKMDERVIKGVITSAYFDLLQKAHDQHYRTLERLQVGLEASGVDCQIVSKREGWPETNGVSYLVAVGGDGTLLAASHHISDHGIPVVGLCSSEMSVGYLCAYRLNQVDKLCQDLLKGAVQFQEVARLQGVIEKAGRSKIIKTEAALNDILFANDSPAVTTRYRCVFNGVSENHRSSGIWVSTPCGSTAVSQTAGGQKVSKSSKNYQFIVRELYTPHGEKPPKLMGDILDFSSDRFEIYNQCEEALLAIDGQHRLYNLEYGDKISFVKAKPIKLAHS